MFSLPSLLPSKSAFITIAYAFSAFSPLQARQKLGIAHIYPEVCRLAHSVICCDAFAFEIFAL